MNTLIKIYLLTMSILSINVSAQNFLKDRDNTINQHLDKFVGIWVWSSGKDSFTLILNKDNVKIVPTMDIYGDVLYGFHKYVKDGKEVENFIQYKNTGYYDKKWSLLGGVEKDKNTTIEISIKSPIRNQRTLFANIEYIDSNRIKIKKIDIRETMLIRQEGDAPFDYSRTLPENIILIKQ